MIGQAGSPQLNWWDGLVESWLNLPLWVQAALAAVAIALAIALVGSVVLWVSSAVRERQARMSIPASIRFGWLAMPGWSKAVQFSLIGVVVLVGFTALSGRPVADLRVSKTEVVFGGVVAGGTATSDLTLTNLGTVGSPAIKVEQVTVSGEDAALFSVVSGAEAVVPSGGDAVVVIAFSPDSTGLKVADLQVVHSGANSPVTVRLSGLGARVVRMNAGGREIGDTPAWSDDRAFLETVRTGVRDDGGLRVSLADPSIPADTPSGLFQSARVSETSSLVYAFPVEPGTYEVRLFFAVLSDAVRSPLLDVTINDEAVIDRLNVVDLAGPGAGLMVPIVVSSSLDTVSVEIRSLLGSPWVNAIEIVDVSQSSGPQLDAPGDIALGPVQMFETVSDDVTLGNVGDRLIDPTVVITAVELDRGTGFVLDQLQATTIGHGNQARGSIALAPTTTGPHQAVMRVDHNGPASPHLITVTGFGWRAIDDAAETLEDEPVVIAVLANDGDPEGVVLTVSDVDRPSNGVATTNGLTVTYQPNPNFNGEDTFGYRVRDSNGAIAAASITVLVTDVNDPPHANANGSYIGSTGVPVAFSSAGSNDPDGTITRYSWSFGDGSFSAATNPSHTYTQPGTYTVVLRVTDDDFATATSSTTARIDPRLSIQKSGDGLGTVTSSPSGISCPGDCSETYLRGTSVTLSATPATGSVFVGWAQGCSGTGGCAISMNDNRTVGAEFRKLFDLNVHKAGTGLGTVTSTPVGINCGTDCVETLVSGDTITLIATPAGSSQFDAWIGCDSVAGTKCIVTMRGSRTVTASFNGAPVANANGPYSGTVGIGVSFSSAGSSDPDGSIAFYLWTFGDGTTSTAANPTHTYSTSGLKTVSLRVTDNDGATDTDFTTADITDVPP
jgi:PKD repeat protein